MPTCFLVPDKRFIMKDAIFGFVFARSVILSELCNPSYVGNAHVIIFIVCNFINIGDILMLQKRTGSLNVGIMIMVMKVASGRDMYAKTCQQKSPLRLKEIVQNVI